MMIPHIVVKGKNIEYDDVCPENDEATMRDEWAEYAKRLLKAELKRRGVSYRQLADRLTEMGTPETERNLSNKISRGGFTAAFMLQVLAAIGCDDLRLNALPEPVGH